MIDFLNFNTFIAPDVLIFFYYIGVVLVPLFLYVARLYIVKKFSFVKSVESDFYLLYSSLSRKNRTILISTLLMIFICMELCWRMMFEVLVGYFDMHNYLYEISENLKG